MKIIVICSQNSSLQCLSLLLCSTCPSLLCSQDPSNISLTLPFNVCVCLWCHTVLHPDANAGRHVVSPSLIDLRSTTIPCDDDEDVEEDDEETYDDIEGLTGPPPPLPSASMASQGGKRGGRQDTGEVDEEDEDIYEVLPGMWMVVTSHAETHKHPHDTHTHTQINRQEGCTHKLS